MDEDDWTEINFLSVNQNMSSCYVLYKNCLENFVKRDFEKINEWLKKICLFIRKTFKSNVMPIKQKQKKRNTFILRKKSGFCFKLSVF